MSGAGYQSLCNHSPEAAGQIIQGLVYNTEIICVGNILNIFPIVYLKITIGNLQMESVPIIYNIAVRPVQSPIKIIPSFTHSEPCRNNCIRVENPKTGVETIYQLNTY